MDAILIKTIHFNCPACHKAVEADAEVAGKLISCPSCGREFNSPAAAPKVSSSWLVVLCMGLATLGLLACLPLLGWRAARFAQAVRPETALQQRVRLQAEAQTVLLAQCTNAIVGLHRIIKQDLITLDDDPNYWTAAITAEYVNRVGGIERTSLPLVFWTFNSPVDNRIHLLCRVDQARITQAERDALDHRFGPAPSSRAPGLAATESTAPK